MQSFHESIRTNVPLHPLLLFFNIVLNIIPSAVYLVLLIVYCHFDLSKRAILWILVFYQLRGIIEIRVIIGFCVEAKPPVPRSFFSSIDMAFPTQRS